MSPADGLGEGETLRDGETDAEEEREDDGDCDALGDLLDDGESGLGEGLEDGETLGDGDGLVDTDGLFDEDGETDALVDSSITPSSINACPEEMVSFSFRISRFAENLNAPTIPLSS